MIPAVFDIPEGRYIYTQRREQVLLTVAGVFVASSVWTLVVARQAQDATQIGVAWDPLLLVFLALWFGAGFAGHIGLQRLRPGRDVILFPAVMTLCGWGTVTIWRLQGAYALRQAVWVCVGTVAMLVTVRWFYWLRVLRKYPYVALLFGATMTVLTLIVGVNPSGSGARLWLGFNNVSWFGQGVFLQPSELLKPLLVIFLAGYLSRHRTLLQLKINGLVSRLPMAFLAPMLVMWGLSLFMVVVQKDLGAGWVLYWGFLCVFYLAARRRRYVALGLMLFIVGAAVAYVTSELVRLRISGWVNLWTESSVEYYQILRGMEAMHTGGLVGAGIGRGAPQNIPLAHSDLIFAAIVTEWGILGAGALLILSAIVIQRIFIVGLSQRVGSYLQLLTHGVGIFLAVQTCVNVGGVLGLLPLTGVPLPFVSYGGSAVVVWFVGLGFVYGGREGFGLGDAPSRLNLRHLSP